MTAKHAAKTIAKPAPALVRHHRVFEGRWGICAVRGGIFLACLIAGAICGALLNDLFALVVGFFAGLLLQEAVCSVVPSLRPRTVPRYLLLTTYRRMRKWYAACTSVLIVWSVACLLLLAFFGHEFEASWPWGIVPWAAVFLIGTGLGAALSGWHCPTCDTAFWFKGAYVRYPHVCVCCGFTVHKDE